jgi:hypothetical protein
VANRVRSCASQVWLATEVSGTTDGAAPYLIFKGDSDAHIVSSSAAVSRTAGWYCHLNGICVVTTRSFAMNVMLPS